MQHGLTNCEALPAFSSFVTLFNYKPSDLGMGAFSSNFVVSESEQIKNLKPSNPQWIFKHAEVHGMPFSEVQRCWRRFLQMGPDKKGVLTKASSVWNSEDVFVKQVLKRLPWSNKATLSFQVYLKLCYWFENIDEVTKIKVIFDVIYQGRPMNGDVMQRLLQYVYPDKTEEELKEIASSVVEQGDYKKIGAIDEEQFIELAKLVPYEHMASILRFDIIPKELHLSS